MQPAIVRVDKATQALDIAKQKLAVMESKINVRISSGSVFKPLKIKYHLVIII